MYRVNKININECDKQYRTLILTVLLEYIGILYQFSKLDWFLETCETLLETPMVKSHAKSTQSLICCIGLVSRTSVESCCGVEALRGMTGHMF